jgi:hypothetical protein
LGVDHRGCVRFGYGAVTHSGRTFLIRSPTQQLGNSVSGLVGKYVSFVDNTVEYVDKFTYWKFFMGKKKLPT